MGHETTRGSLDGFLDYSSKAPKTGGHLGGWKRNKDEEHGEITTWMHVNFMPTPFWCHPTYTVIENKKDEKLIAVPRRWTCHENDAIAKLQKWRNDDGTSEHRPLVCPMCIMTNVVARMVDAGEIGFTDPVFEWKGSEDTVQILAGGIYGHFRKKKGLLREHEVAMRKAKIRQTDAFQHDMRTQLRYLFAIVDAANVDRGILTTVESEGLANKIRAAIVAEGMKVQAQTRTDMRDERVRGQWDPARNPYPLIWMYDATKDFDEKFNVVALRGTEIPDDVRALIVDGDLPDTSDLEPGNCFELRAELEEHCKVELPWDEIFGPAAEKGLMSPPEESKREVEEDGARSERTPEIRGGAGTKQEASDEPIRIGPDHAAWKSKVYKPGPEFKGREVHVLPPSDAKDQDVERVLAAFEKVAKVVVEVVACEHCEGEMTTVDPSCPTCGAEYDDDGKLKTRPCANDPCDAQVPLEGDGPKYICPKCASIHEVDADGAWKVVPNEPAPAASPRRRRGGAASTNGGANFPPR